jgi:hypothetical protein
MIYTLVFYLFTAQGVIVQESKLKAFTDGNECVSYIPDVQNQMVASLPSDQLKLVASGDIAARVVCTSALSM